MVPSFERPREKGRPALQKVAPGSAPLAPEVYAELRTLAARALRNERRGHTLAPTALANEALARLSQGRSIEGADRTQLLALVARTVRQILVDHARSRRARLDHERLSIETRGPALEAAQLDLLALDEALSKLAQLHERQARVVELRFFGGLSVDETALVLAVSPRTVDADWHVARAWLARELREEGPR